MSLFNNASAGVWSWVTNNLPTDLAWTAIASSASGKYQITAAVDNSIYYSQDYGVNWEISNSLNNVSYISLASNSVGDYMYAVDTSDDTNIHISTNYGKDWITLPVDYTNNDQWKAVATNCNGKVVAVLGHISDGIHLSYNYGKDFQLNGIVYPGIAFNDIAISCDGSYMIAVAENSYLEPKSGGIYINTGGGFGMALSQITTSNNWTSCAINSEGTVMYAVDALTKGGLFKSINKGTTWTRMMSTGTPASSYFNSISCDYSGNYIIASYVSPSSTPTSKVKLYTYSSYNGGLTWSDTWSRTGSLDVAVGSGQQLASLSSSVLYGLGIMPSDPDVSKLSGVYMYARCPYGTTIAYTGYNGSYACTECEPGYYVASYDISIQYAECSACPKDTYSVNQGTSGIASCLSCPYPLATSGTGATQCTIVYLNGGFGGALPVSIVFALLMIYLIWTGSNNVRTTIAVLLFPLAGIFTQFAYILTTRFSNVAVLFCCLGSLLCTFPWFIYKLIAYDAVAPFSAVSFWWIGYSYGAKEVANIDITSAAPVDNDFVPFPTVNGKRFSILFTFQSHSNLWTLLWEILTWFVAGSLQLITLIVGPLLLFAWLLIGLLLQITHVMSLTVVWNNWFRIWLGDNRLDDLGKGDVDTYDLNSGLLIQSIFGNISFICFYAINNSSLDLWLVPSSVAAWSMSLVITIDMLNICYHYVYRNFIVCKKLKVADIPLHQLTVMGVLLTYLFPSIHIASYRKSLDIYQSFEREKFLGVPVTNGDEVQDVDVSTLTEIDDIASRPYLEYTPPITIASTPDFAGFYGSHMHEAIASHTSDQSEVANPPPLYADEITHNPILAKSATNADAYSPVEEDPDYVSVDSSSVIEEMNATMSQMSTPALQTEQIPPQFLCPLTKSIMVTPVMAEDGYTYEQTAILKYVSENHCSPVTQAPMSAAVMLNRSIFDAILAYHAACQRDNNQV